MFSDLKHLLDGQEELLSVRTHLGNSPGLYHRLDAFPLFPVAHDGCVNMCVPMRKSVCSD